jgi:hypothetical protein
LCGGLRLRRGGPHTRGIAVVAVAHVDGRLVDSLGHRPGYRWITGLAKNNRSRFTVLRPEGYGGTQGHPGTRRLCGGRGGHRRRPSRWTTCASAVAGATSRSWSSTTRQRPDDGCFGVVFSDEPTSTTSPAARYSEDMFVERSHPDLIKELISARLPRARVGTALAGVEGFHRATTQNLSRQYGRVARESGFPEIPQPTVCV